MNANSDDDRGIDAFGDERNGAGGRERASDDAIVVIAADSDGALELFATESGSSPIARPIADDSLDLFAAETAHAGFATETQPGRPPDVIAFDHASTTEEHPFVVPAIGIVNAQATPPEYFSRDTEFVPNRAAFPPVRASIRVAQGRSFGPRRLLIALLFVEIVAAAAVAGIFVFRRSPPVPSCGANPPCGARCRRRARCTHSGRERKCGCTGFRAGAAAGCRGSSACASCTAAVGSPASGAACCDKRQKGGSAPADQKSHCCAN